MQSWKCFGNASGAKTVHSVHWDSFRAEVPRKGLTQGLRQTGRSSLKHEQRLKRLHSEDPRFQHDDTCSPSQALEGAQQSTDRASNGSSALSLDSASSSDQATGDATDFSAPAPDAVPSSDQQQRQRQPWGVPPWGMSTTITLMVVWLVVFWFAAYSAVPAVLRICGLESMSAEPRIQALRHFLLDTFQTLSTLLILRQGLQGYHPRKLGMFSFSLKTWKQWRLPLLAGCITFPAIDWVHKQLVAWLAADDYLLNGTVEQIASASDWTAHVLWYVVLAMCAPLWEEVMFRGFLLPSMLRHLPQWGAVVLSAVIFSMVHFTVEGFLPLLLLGLVFGAVYVQTRNMWPPILLHSLWNIMLLVQIKASAPV